MNKKKKDDLTLKVVGDSLTIRGRNQRESEHGDQRNYYVPEIRAESFERMVLLPAEVVAGRAEAELKDGVLRVTLPKTSAAKEKVRHIKVKAA